MPRPVRIFLTHTPAARAHYYGARALAELRALGEVALHEGDAPLDGAGLIEAAREAAVIVADRATPGPAEIFTALPELRAFVRVAVDISTIDVPAASAAGVLVTQAGPAFVNAVVELVLGFLVDLSRGISRAAVRFQAGVRPVPAMGREVRGGTLGIIGYGSIGRSLAPLGLALGMRVVVSDPHRLVATPGVTQLDFHELLAESDYVVCLAVATAVTERLMNAEAFARMRPGSFFINVARGNLVDDAALLAALEGGGLAGAAIDVGRDPDQMPTLELACHPRVIATPHIGGLTPAAIAGQALETVQQVRQILAGHAPQGAVNTAHWHRAG
jgi:D-3-phosphoglycerate dehydrogenase